MVIPAYRRCANDVTDVKVALAAIMVISRRYQKMYFLIEQNVFFQSQIIL